MKRVWTLTATAVLCLVFGASLAFAGNVCVICHSGLPGKYGEPVQLWQGSIHAQNNVFCNDCHGGNPTDAALAMNPAQGFLGVPAETEIPDRCGKCHVGIFEEYSASAHGQALAAGGPNCVTCHGNHAIVAPSLAMINEALCGRCHTFERAAAIKSILAKGEEEIARLQDEIRHYAHTGTDAGRQEKGLFEARNSYRRLMHELDAAKLRAGSALLESELRRIDRELGVIAGELQARKLWGAVMTGLFLLLAFLFFLLGKSYAHRQE